VVDFFFRFISYSVLFRDYYFNNHEEGEEKKIGRVNNLMIDINFRNKIHNFN
jgi:hypothetical protein